MGEWHIIQPLKLGAPLGPSTATATIELQLSSPILTKFPQRCHSVNGGGGSCRSILDVTFVPLPCCKHLLHQCTLSAILHKSEECTELGKKWVRIPEQVPATSNYQRPPSFLPGLLCSFPFCPCSTLCLPPLPTYCWQWQWVALHWHIYAAASQVQWQPYCAYCHHITCTTGTCVPPAYLLARIGPSIF